MHSIPVRAWLVTILCAFACISDLHAQQLLARKISLTVKREPLSQVLQHIGEKGDFYFSYNSNLIPRDSLVSLQVSNQTVQYTLQRLFGNRFSYKETGNYLIIQPGKVERQSTISGYILDDETGEKADLVSIYDKTRFVATVSNDQGYFRLRVKDRSVPLSFTVSKIGYGDTTLTLPANQEVTIRIKPKAILLDEVTINPNSRGERTWLGRTFLSRRLRAQSQNLSRFFVNLPYQIALTPGLGSHGRLSSQVVNKVSLNLLGGYNAGVQGVEIAGVFNIIKNDVRSVQLAGLFNLVGSSVNGFQAAGLLNLALDTLRGVQIAGISNRVQTSQRSVQIAGVFNTADVTHGSVQLAGVLNQARRGTASVQISGLVNHHRDTVTGAQVTSLYNYARHVKGLQLGLINVADSSSGYSLGLINLIRNGKMSVTLAANDVVPFQLTFKSGTHRLYTILLLGYSPFASQSAFTFGAGLGREFRLGIRWSLATDLTSQNLYQGNWDTLPILARLETSLQFRINPHWTFSAGPALSLTYADQPSEVYTSPKAYPHWNLSPTAYGWVGWQGGVQVNF
ncbi:hypothetical protein BWI93_15405 [Siphonobacter sp. BAB-5385]|uniref:carboxypeptidase-like regulatory domain-containing protein n=1 Tax=Siphonobacter sp. BAB-5385 TaxID=1864822 RepID=UPI000B9E0D2E|nr:carboxypeptidase-like regulatory domain-containing protein [Siphonobacter sp. BAB-5385]OZI07398.1 hypothetical protein BWI93_15405 [Siphonobacter sp. BAB-5385]